MDGRSWGQTDIKGGGGLEPNGCGARRTDGRGGEWVWGQKDGRTKGYGADKWGMDRQTDRMQG